MHRKENTGVGQKPLKRKERDVKIKRAKIVSK
jgi:hypothetical protein